MQVITRPRRQASRRAWPCSPISASGALEASAIHYLGLVQLLTGHYPAAATSVRLALQLNRELGCRFREAETLTFLGDLAAPAADTGQALRQLLRRPGRRPPGRACPKRKRPPWKASAGSTSRTAIPAKQPAACARPSSSTSAPGTRPPSGSSTRSPTTACSQLAGRLPATKPPDPHRTG